MRPNTVEIRLKPVAVIDMMYWIAVWYRMILVIIFEQNFLFYFSVMLEADPS